MLDLGPLARRRGVIRVPVQPLAPCREATVGVAVTVTRNCSRRRGPLARGGTDDSGTAGRRGPSLGPGVTALCDYEAAAGTMTDSETRDFGGTRGPAPGAR